MTQEHGTNPVTGVQNALGTELAEAISAALPNSSYTHLSHIPAREATYDAWPDWLHQPLRAYLEDQGIQAPYQHQKATAEHLWHGQHVVVATGTSSGKSLGYQLPILSYLAAHPNATAMYLTPTKALGADQLLNFQRFCNNVSGLEDVYPCPYDGDTAQDARGAIREHARLLVTNPDMVHSAILPGHRRFGRILRNLQFIVVDECHTYRGVFGAGVALVLRRLLRLARRYGANPVVAFASATANNPGEHAQMLLGEPVATVDSDTAPQGARSIMLWEPGIIPGASGEHGAPVKRAASTEAASIMATTIAEGARTLCFLRSRAQAETTALRCAETLGSMGRFADAKRIAAYRAGYLAEDRRRIEQQLDNGELLGVASTNALELGIDVGGLDVVITAGFPGTVASFWQQAGRAGRRGQGSLVVLVGRDEPMDTYLIHHPEALLDRPIERIIINPYNPHILAGHLYCAAIEVPLDDAWVASLQAEQVVAELVQNGWLRRRGEKWFAVEPPGAPPAHSQVQLRGSGAAIAIIDSSDGRLLGTIDQARAMSQVHPGAVYLHQGESFVINDLDLAEHVALATPSEPPYHTYSRSDTQIRIIGEAATAINPSPGVWISNLDVEVTTQVTGYIAKGFDGEVLEQVALDLPPQTLITRAVAYTIDPLVLDKLGISDIPGALHAAEHAAIGILPLIATCDRWDIGGVSTQLHPDTLLPTVFVYDGHPGGAGFADCGYQNFAQWITATYDAVVACSCEHGCPSCVQSPKCGNGNQPLHKQDAATLLGALVCGVGSAHYRTK